MSKPFSDTAMNVDVKNFTVNNQNIDNGIELSSWSCRRGLSWFIIFASMDHGY